MVRDSFTVRHAVDELGRVCGLHTGPCALDCYVIAEVRRYLRGEIAVQHIPNNAYRAYSHTIHKSLFRELDNETQEDGIIQR